MAYLCSDRFAWTIKEVDLCIILYRNIWRIYVNLCQLIWMYGRYHLEGNIILCCLDAEP